MGPRTRPKDKGGNEGVLRAPALGASALSLIGCIALLTSSLPCKVESLRLGKRGKKRGVKPKG